MPNPKPWENIPPTGRMFRPKVVCDRSGLSKTHLHRLIAEGEFPPFIRLSANVSVLPESWFDAFIQHRAELSK